MVMVFRSCSRRHDLVIACACSLQPRAKPGRKAKPKEGVSTSAGTIDLTTQPASAADPSAATPEARTPGVTPSLHCHGLRSDNTVDGAVSAAETARCRTLVGQLLSSLLQRVHSPPRRQQGSNKFGEHTVEGC